MDVTPSQCPRPFARCHRLRNRLRAVRVTVKLTSGFQWQELIESFLGMCGRPLEPNGEPRSGVASAACGGKAVRQPRQRVGLIASIGV